MHPNPSERGQADLSGWGQASERGRSVRSERGQASIELVACLPIVALLALALWQAAVAGQAAWLSGSAARAAARADAVGADPLAAARGVLPERLEVDLRIRRAKEGDVVVAVPVPLVVGSGRLGMIDAQAKFEPQDG